jgi:hypothetical protein
VEALAFFTELVRDVADPDGDLVRFHRRKASV